jgi:hypothetical protein
MSNYDNDKLMKENYNLYMRALNRQSLNNEDTYFDDYKDKENFQSKNNNYPGSNEIGQRNEYEELKNAYMNQLMSEKNLNYMYNPEKINYNANDKFQSIENSHNLNESPVYLNSQVYGRRPQSEKNLDKEYKRKQQEEYRKFLDQQLREQNEKKERMKLEKKGLISPEGSRDIHQKLNYNNDKINPLTSHNHVNSSNPTTPNPRLNPEREFEKKKKLNYQSELLRQIEEQKKIKEEEKKKRLEAELRYEERYNQNLPEERTRGRKLKNNLENTTNNTTNKVYFFTRKYAKNAKNSLYN